MSRSLTPSLVSAINARTRVPAIACTIEDHVQHFTTYQSPGNADAYNDACIAADSSIVRVQVTRGGTGLNQNFQFQRITNPGTASQWSTWTTFSGGSANMFQDGGCAISNNGGTLRAFAQRTTGGTDLRVWTSTTNGASWTGPVTVLTPPAGALIQGIGSGGNNDVFFLYQVTGGTAMGASFFSGSWSTLTTWTLPNTLSGAGVAVWWDGGVYTLIYSDSYALYEATFNPSSSTWTALPQIAQASTTIIGRVSPRISFDAQTNLWNLVCAEFDTGSITGTAYKYPRVRQSADRLHWSGGKIVHDISTSFGACYLANIAGAFNAGYLISMPTIMRAPFYSASNANQFLNVGGSVLSYIHHEAPGKPATLEITLDNNQSALNTLVGNATNFQPINLNTSIVLKEGYKTGSPPSTIETIQVGIYHIAQIHFERRPGRNRITLVAHDLTRNLDLSNRFQMTYSNQTLSWLVSEICTCAGIFNIFLPFTSQVSQVIPTFVLQSHQTYRRALDELCNTYHLAYFLDENETLQFRELNASDFPIWTYQPEIEEITLGSNDHTQRAHSRANHIIVTGKPPISGFLGAMIQGEAFDDTDMQRVGLERLLQHVDPKLTTATQCHLKAQFLLAQQQRQGTQHTITIPVNPALQPLDVVTITDYGAPVGSEITGNVRIVDSQVEYEAQAARYRQKVGLEGV